MNRFQRLIPALAVLALTTAAMPRSAHAQQGPPPDNGGGGGDMGGPGGGPDGGRPPSPAQMQQRMIRNLKRTLGADDATFDSLKPDVEKIVQLQQALSSGGRMGRPGPPPADGNGGPGGGDDNGGPAGDQKGGGGGGGGADQGRGGGGADQAVAEVKQDPMAVAFSKAVRQLKETLRPSDDGAAPADADLAQQVKAVRDARAKAVDELAAARKSLRAKLKSAHDEAVFVAAGILE